MVLNNNLLLCTDLDRTLLPNGAQPESPNARPLFKQLVAHTEVKLAYVSGRDKGLLLEAIRQYDLPVPDFAIADVGTTIYTIDNNEWHIWDKWHEEIGIDWGTYNQGSLAELLSDITQLQLQETAKQGKYKLSYYADEITDTVSLFSDINSRFVELGIRANLIWSIDETTHTGLLDILPQSANKLHAIHFLIEQSNFTKQNTVFAGDSGNDLEVLCSNIQAVLVNNATPEVRQQAISLARENGAESQLYCAKGGLLGMNGNYAAGILEGIVHYLPQTLNWLQSKS